MSKKRAIAKYLTAGSATAMFGLGVWQAYQDPDRESPKSPRRVAIAAAVMTAAMWTTALL